MQWAITYSWFPFRVLQTFYALKIEDIGIGTLNTARLQTVVVEIEMMLGGTGGHLIGRSYHLLVVAIEKVDLKALDTHISIMLHHRLSNLDATLGVVANQVTPTRPENYTHAFLFSIGDQSGEVNFWA